MRRATKGVLAMGLGVAVAGSLSVTANAAGSTQSASAGAAKKAAGTEVREDFNGDGYNDLAVGAPEGNGGAGYLTVVYGSAKGLDTANPTRIDKDTAGIPDSVGDRFGSRLVGRDLDGDGVTDLAVQGGYGGDNYLIALWGAKGRPLSGKDAVSLGSATYVVGGDFDGDKKDDLFTAAGTSGSLLQGPFTRDGKPAKSQDVDLEDGDADTFGLTAGDFDGDGADDLVAFRSMEEMARPGAHFKGGEDGLTKVDDKAPKAMTGTSGDFDGDGYDDLAYRVPDGDVIEGPWSDSGTVKVQYGSADGPSTRTATFTQATSGVPGANEEGDLFGTSLSAGDINGDGYDDLAAGVPGEAIGTKDKAGSVVLLKGTKSGLTGAGAQAFNQDTEGVPGVAEAGDLLGANLRVQDFDNDGKADLAVGAPGENDHNGAVWAFPGGVSTSKAISFAPGDLGAPADGATFGATFSGSVDSQLWGIEDR